jgi:hypothetical protein
MGKQSGFNLYLMKLLMTEALSEDEMFRREALRWYHETNTTPQRLIAEETIVEVYKKIKEYAQKDPLLREYYQANHMKI